MILLLDTHAFLWIVADLPNLSKKAKNAFLNEKYQIMLSMASIWEMSIKISLGKLIISQPFNKFIPEQLQQNNIILLDINFKHVNKIINLPFHHRDPFDRLIIAQALVEDVPIISNDAHFDLYNIKRVW